MSDSISRLSFWKLLGVSFMVALGVWLWFSWPLPRYAGAGIPAAAHREAADVQRLIPGDHLQFMYYCWLAGDMVAVKTPLFYNLYEFNTGNDRERFEPDAYYIPFSLIYAAGAWLGGRAFGWNLTGFISLWLTYLLTWLLVRRWTRNEWVAVIAALLGIVLPFRWINLFGGSPAGFAMTWIPAILLGVDLAVREDRVRGGVLAGAALLLASWGDSHVFFFGALAAPAWGIVAFAGRTDFQWRQGASYRRLGLALLPIGLFAVAALLFPVLMKGLYRAVMGLAPVAHAIGPRTLREVMLFAPDWQGLFGVSKLGISAHIYLGVIVPAFITAGWLALVRPALGSLLKIKDKRMLSVNSILPKNPGLTPREVTRPTENGSFCRPGDPTGRVFQRNLNLSDPELGTLIILTLMILGMLVIIILALGPRGPEHGLFFKLCRLVIPPYAMIRQPAKIFCLMPSFLAVASAVALTALVQFRAGLPPPKRFLRRQGYGGQVAQAGRAWAILMPAVFAGLILWDYARQSNPTISLLEKKQEAYAAVAANAAGAADAAAGQAAPGALVLPLWPGDSHYASIYQYFASIYRVRMVNGYNPFIKQGYFENVFRRFESVNQGGLSEDQVAGLIRMNVRYILLHEDLFPEKVSPFPVTATLRQLLRHPRLELLRQDGSVWAFKILDSPRNKTNRDFNPLRFSRTAATSGSIVEAVRQNGIVAALTPDQSATLPDWDILFPARRFEMEKTSAERRVTVIKSPAAGGRAYVALSETNASLRTVPIRVASVSDLHWLARARGHGSLAGTLMVDERATVLKPIPIQADDWIWLNLPVPAFQGFAALSLKLTLKTGAVDLDLNLLTAGPWRQMNPGESVTLPAPLFFHAGHIDLKSGSVIFRRDYDRQGIVFYGPKLPLPKGTYEVDVAFTSPAATGTVLATINLEQHATTGAGVAVPVIAGQPARGRWRQYENLPFNLALVYNTNADLEIQRITITRLK